MIEISADILPRSSISVCSVSFFLFFFIYIFLFHNVGLSLDRGYEAEGHVKAFEQISSASIPDSDSPTGMVTVTCLMILESMFYIITNSVHYVLIRKTILEYICHLWNNLGDI